MKPTYCVLLLAALPACRPDAPATEQAAPPVATATVAHPADTLHLPTGVVQLLPSSAEEFNKLPASSVPDVANDSLEEVKSLATAQGRVRRTGRDLLLKADNGREVRLTSTPAAEFTIQNGDAVRYQYQGSLPGAHQWVVRAWFWESTGTLLVDQRTGRRLEVLGQPAMSADGRFLVLTSPGLGGGDQPNTVSLVQIDDDGPRLRWQRELTAWQAEEARWAHPGITILKIRHTNAQGELPNDAPVSYVQLPMPR
ncbi:hypothetical protein Q5H93_12185 [Hymenobacter sp. ASUV-10]|uniref:Lipoprotein n=1 Tax=Hymenobacter aranciens TaxID=3063996 RepID=A0ABT9BB78_9BACT|nr:hypothetical protein [Hymenobacter sp. ASUV-10]MDO7875493.1 hypothetical protein [Hymenobacter sp. ASUV-10]